MINDYDFPEISYFNQKEKKNNNDFFGSNGENFRYRISNIDDKLTAFVWFEDVCFDLAQNTVEETFELSNDGLVKAIEWIFEQKK